MKIASVVGARPQFIKCAPLSREIRKENSEILIHTGQHYDPEMSDIFFEELHIPRPDYHLGVGSGSHGGQTGEMLGRIEEVLMKERPDLVLVYGDTNSTLAGALAAVKLHLPVAHVEAGLRSYDRTMPEEVNRVLTDHISTLLFCPSKTAVDNLAAEGIDNGVHITGDVMVDALYYNKALAFRRIHILEELSLDPGKYLVLTIHRPSNTDNNEKLESIIDAIADSGMPVLFPVHPRTKKYLQQFGLWDRMPGNFRITGPQGYLEMLCIMAHAHAILTDSGGIQKEAYLLRVPCITLRDTTEWIETLENGWNFLVSGDAEAILRAIEGVKIPNLHPDYYGDGFAARRCVVLVEKQMSV
jgi:UDP-GlcNAc3NAcA epimerase